MAASPSDGRFHASVPHTGSLFLRRMCQIMYATHRAACPCLLYSSNVSIEISHRPSVCDTA